MFEAHVVLWPSSYSPEEFVIYHASYHTIMWSIVFQTPICFFCGFPLFFSYFLESVYEQTTLNLMLLIQIVGWQALKYYKMCWVARLVVVLYD